MGWRREGGIWAATVVVLGKGGKEFRCGSSKVDVFLDLGHLTGYWEGYGFHWCLPKGAKGFEVWRKVGRRSEGSCAHN